MEFKAIGDFKFGSHYQINDQNIVVAVKDDAFPDRNIIPLFYKDEEGLVMEIDENDVGERIFIKRGNDIDTQDLETRFFLQELFKIFRGPLNPNDRYDYDQKLPKKYTYKNKLQHLDTNEIIEVFEAHIEQATSRILIIDPALREMVNNTYMRDNKVLFVKYDDKVLGPFSIKKSDKGYFIVEKSLRFEQFGLFTIPDMDLLKFIANGIFRMVIYDPEILFQIKPENFDFVSDEEIVEWFNSSVLTNSENFDKVEIEQLKKTIDKVLSSDDVDKETNRYKRFADIITTTNELIISKSKLAAIVPELDIIKEEIKAQEKKALELRNDIEKKSKEAEAQLNLKSTLEEKLVSLKEEIKKFTERKEEEQQKIESEMIDKITKLNTQIAELDITLNEEKDKRSKHLNQIREDILFEERKKDELKTAIDTLRKEFIDEQKNAQEKLGELVKSKTHFDFISGKDLSENQQNDFDANNYTISRDGIENYSKLREGLSNILKSHQRNYSEHFIDNLLISIHQNTLTLFAGLPGTGKTSLAKILASALTAHNRIKEIPIGRGWTSQKDLIGFSNPLSKNFYEAQTGVYQLLKQLDSEWGATSYMNSPMAYVLLDEANLSPMEHYWSTFYNSTDSVARLGKPLKIDLGQTEQVKYANSLRFIGTINYDQTTEELSPRILDRINVIRLTASQNQIDSIVSGDIQAMNLSLQKCIEFFNLSDFRDVNFEISIPEKVREKYYEVKKLFEKINIYISPRVEIGIKRYCQTASAVMTDEYRPLDYCIAQRLLPLINFQGDKRTELVELRESINSLKLEESVSIGILDNIINIGSRDGYTKDNYNYFLTLTHV